jgi:hypothetical protein
MIPSSNLTQVDCFQSCYVCSCSEHASLISLETSDSYALPYLLILSSFDSGRLLPTLLRV